MSDRIRHQNFRSHHDRHETRTLRDHQFLKTNFDERRGAFSPDLRWVAYQSNESGRAEIYVRPFTTTAGINIGNGQWQVSTDGGTFPRWRGDGKELGYIGPNGEMMAAPILVAGGRLEPGSPTMLFQTKIFGGGGDAGPRQYDIARDGRFLINTVLDDAGSPITLIENWKPPLH